VDKVTSTIKNIEDLTYVTALNIIGWEKECLFRTSLPSMMANDFMGYFNARVVENKSFQR